MSADPSSLSVPLSPWKCHHCMAYFHDRHALCAHLISPLHHKGEEKIWTCDTCTTAYAPDFELICFHSPDLLGQFIIDLKAAAYSGSALPCNMAPGSSSSSSSSSKPSHSPFSCDHSPAALPAIPLSPWQCPHCHGFFSNGTKLGNHVIRHHHQSSPHFLWTCHECVLAFGPDFAFIDDHREARKNWKAVGRFFLSAIHQFHSSMCTTNGIYDHDKCHVLDVVFSKSSSLPDDPLLNASLPVVPVTPVPIHSSSSVSASCSSPPRASAFPESTIAVPDSSAAGSPPRRSSSSDHVHDTPAEDSDHGTTRHRCIILDDDFEDVPEEAGSHAAVKRIKSENTEPIPDPLPAIPEQPLLPNPVIPPATRSRDTSEESDSEPGSSSNSGTRLSSNDDESSMTHTSEPACDDSQASESRSSTSRIPCLAEIRQYTVMPNGRVLCLAEGCKQHYQHLNSFYAHHSKMHMELYPQQCLLCQTGSVNSKSLKRHELSMAHREKVCYQRMMNEGQRLYGVNIHVNK